MPVLNFKKLYFYGFMLIHPYSSRTKLPLCMFSFSCFHVNVRESRKNGPSVGCSSCRDIEQKDGEIHTHCVFEMKALTYDSCGIRRGARDILLTAVISVVTYLNSFNYPPKQRLACTALLLGRGISPSQSLCLAD